jgi:hypothetical protein
VDGISFKFDQQAVKLVDGQLAVDGETQQKFHIIPSWQLAKGSVDVAGSSH